MNDKLFSAISLCRKAGKLRMGNDVVVESVKKQETHLILLAKDVAPRTARQVQFACEGHKVQIMPLPYTMDELWQITTKRYGVFAVCDNGFAKMIEGLITPLT